MLQVLTQTNLDTTIFIGNDEPNYKIVGLNLGLFKKGYHCDGIGATIATVMNNIDGLRVRFTKTEQKKINSSSYQNRYNRSIRSFFKRITSNENTSTELSVSRGIKFERTEVSLKLVPSPEDRKKLLDIDILSRYSRHIKTTEEMSILPHIQASLELHNTDFSPKLEEEEMAKLHIDSAVVKVKTFEENFKYLYPLLVLRNLTGQRNTSPQHISLAEFDKFSRQIDIVKELSIPTKCARKKFIELCEIFKDNKVLPKLKANNFEFRNYQTKLTVDLFGIQIVNEENFKPFYYFDHPGVNFCADFLDKAGTFDSVEAKISKEIITRI